MNLNKLRLKNNISFKYSIFIFLIALIFRILLINVMNTDTMASDGVIYHKLAYNLFNGNGYSLSTHPPFTKYYFREPGFPVFLSFSFHISKLFGNEIENLTYNEDNFKILNNASEVTIAKYMNAILSSLSCVLFFLLISSIIRFKFAFIVTIIFCFYYPYAFHVTHILRETLQSFLALSMCYTLLQYFKYEKFKYLMLTGFFWGLLNLTFQASVVFLVSILIFIWVFNKNFINAIVPSLIVVFFMLITVSPWLIRTYIDYPDWRIIKSCGTSLTPELRNGWSSLLKAKYYGLINEEEKFKIKNEELFGLTDDEKFRLSWDGTLKRKADSINALINEPLISKRRIEKYSIYFYKAWFPTKILSISTRELIKTKPILAAILILPIILLGLFAFIGVFKFYPKFFKINIIFTTYMAIFFLISSEYRRMLPALPFIFLYGMLGIIYIYKRYKKGFRNVEIKGQILIN